MKSASAMKYGGELVDAVDCDYDSFKELIPLCPNCKEPVFLRIGGQRESAKGKAYQIGPHWCHFKGISAEQVAGCELRVNGYTEKDRAKIANQARGQRLKLLQRWFWKIIANNFSARYGFAVEAEERFVQMERALLDAGNNPMKDKVFHVFLACSSDWDNQSSLTVRRDDSYSDNVVSEFQDFHKVSLDSVMEFPMHSVVIEALTRYNKEHPEIVESHYKRYMDEGNWVPKGIDAVIHSQIVAEVHQFILSAKNRALLASLLSLEMSILSLIPVMGGWFSDEICRGYPPVDVLTSAVAKVICSIPWASEFQRLEAEAKQRKGAA